MRSRVQPVLRLALAAVFFAFLLPAHAAAAQAPQPNEPSSLPEAPIRELAAKTLKNAGKAGCKPRDCRIAVTDFSFTSGMTSPLGMQLADQLARELSSQPNAIPVVDRAQLRSDLEQQRIVGELLRDEKAMRWFGHAVGATAILAGTIENSGSSVLVNARLLSCENENKATPQESFTFSYSGPADDLNPTEPFTEKPTNVDWPSPQMVPEAGKNGVKSPACVFCPNPNYSDPARLAKFNGSAVLQVVVSTDGQVMQARIVRGLPFGLNEASLNAVRGWRFRPATQNGIPTTTQVNIEVMFRLLSSSR